MYRRLTLLAALTWTGIACAPRTAPVTTATPVPAVTHTTWVTRSAEFGVLTRQVFGQASAAVERAAAGKARGSWVVVADADETLISNLTFQVELERDGRPYSAASWAAWTRRREATAIPGAKAFLDRVRSLGGRIAIVTNRLESECADTRANLDALSLNYDVVLCRPDGGPSDKNPRFGVVSAGRWLTPATSLEVLAFLGDNILDFPGLSQGIRQGDETAYAEFGARFFMLPNPMYGSWQ